MFTHYSALIIYQQVSVYYTYWKYQYLFTVRSIFVGWSLTIYYLLLKMLLEERLLSPVDVVAWVRLLLKEADDDGDDNDPLLSLLLP